MKLTETFSDERAVSPVVGVILMVAITVILAAVIGTFVLNLGSDQTEPAQAGIDFEVTNPSGVDVRLTVTDIGNADALQVDASDSSGSVGTTFPADPSVGDSATVTGATEGDTIRVIGTNDGKENIVAEFEV